MDYVKFMEEVRAREAQIGLLRDKGFTLQQIGDRFDITAERVRQILLRQDKTKKKNPAEKRAQGAH